MLLYAVANQQEIKGMSVRIAHSTLDEAFSTFLPQALNS